MPTHKQLFELVKELIAKKLHKKSVGRGKIAEYLGVSQGKVRAWEEGQRPSSDDLESLVKLFNFSPTWLLTGEGNTFLGEGTEAAEQKKDESITDPIAQRMKVAADSLEKAGASPELIQQTFFKILELQNEPHTQAEETLRTPAFANDRDRSIKQP